MMRSLQCGVGGLCLVLLAAGPAAAQEAIVEGPGIELGEGTVFHPSVSLETGYVSNVFYEADDPVGSGIIRLIGAFSIASQTHKPPGELEAGVETEADEESVEEPPPPAMVDFRLGAEAILNGYISDDERIRDQTDVGVGVDGSVIFNPHGDVALGLNDKFLRDTRPTNFESTRNLNRDYNHFTGGVTYQPQGRTITVGARYENIIDRFESDQSAFANRLQHLVGLRGDWRWLPYTKFYLDASLGFFGSLGDEGESFKSGSNPLRVVAGIGTALTEVTTVRGYIGYANGFYDQRQNFQNVIGGAEFGWRYMEYGRLRLIADYNFQDSLQANFFRDYSLIALVEQQFGLIVASADAGVRLRAYRGIPMELGPADRDDVLFNAGAQIGYLLRDWFALTLRGQALIDSTDYTYSAGGVMASPEFTRLEAYIGATAAF
jgi:hypothetical protein